MNTGTEPVFSKYGLLTTVASTRPESSPVWHCEVAGHNRSARAVDARQPWADPKESDIEVLEFGQDTCVYFVPHFSGLFAPYWRSDARGVIVGLTRYANKGHLARAVLSTAYKPAKYSKPWNLIRQEAESLRTDGGMVEDELLMQFQADILNRTVIPPS